MGFQRLGSTLIVNGEADYVIRMAASLSELTCTCSFILLKCRSKESINLKIPKRGCLWSFYPPHPSPGVTPLPLLVFSWEPGLTEDKVPTF